MHYKDKTYIPTQGLVVIGINTLEQDDNKVKSFMRKPTSGKKVPKLGDPRGSYSLQKVNNNVVLVCFLCFMFYVLCVYLCVCLCFHTKLAILDQDVNTWFSL